MRRTVSVLLLSILLLSSPGRTQQTLQTPQTPQTKEIVVWHSYQGAARLAFEKVVESYRGKGGWRAAAVAMPADLLASRAASLIPRGEGPDLFLYTQDRLGAWAGAGKIVEPIAPDSRMRARFLPGCWDAMTYRGKVYGVPLDVRVLALFFNRSLLPEAPLSSKEMATQARRLTSPELGKFGLATWYTDFYYHAPLMHAYGGRVFDESGEPTLNAAPNVKSVQLLRSWLRQGFLPAGPTTTLITSLFNEGKLGMVIAGPSFAQDISPSVQFAVAPLPVVDEAGGKPMRPWMTVQGVYLAAASRSKAAALDLALYLTDLPAGVTLAVEGRLLPAHAGVYLDGKVTGDLVMQGFRRQLDTATPMPNLPGMNRIWGPLARALEAVAERRLLPRDALDQAQREILQDR